MHERTVDDVGMEKFVVGQQEVLREVPGRMHSRVRRTVEQIRLVEQGYVATRRIIEHRLGKKQLGFTFDLVEGERVTDDNSDPADIFSQALPEDLLKFGMIPEFVGRLPVFTAVAKLDREALVAVLTEPRNALTKQYQRLFELDSVGLEFEPAALEEIAEQALKRGTGARGLRAILEEVLLNVMYEVPSRTDVGKVVISGEVVRGNVNPTLVPREVAPRRERRDKSA